MKRIITIHLFPIVKKKEGHSVVPKELALSCN